MQRQQCGTEACRATFEVGTPHDGTIRFCNRSGPDGGHPSRFDGQSWQAVADHMEHDQQ
jgi:hypothetical protein